MKTIKRNWKRAPKKVRQTLTFIVGSTLVLTGLAMLVLPGPGWAAIFLGFAILATEFTVAEKARDWMIAQLKLVVGWARQQWRNIGREHKP
jgi:uncharacterized protein (TIGR02611 family)